MEPTLSIVVPCFNEAEVIAECHSQLTKVLQGMAVPYEIVFVDDGSSDATPFLLEELHLTDREHVTIGRLSRNFGHQIGVTAGLTLTRGAAVVIIDADLQDPPELIPEMFRLWREGFQVVYGVRDVRKGESRFKLITAKLFYRLMNGLSDVEIPLDTGDFRLIDRKVVQALAQMPERHRLLRGMGSWIGFKQTGLRYERHARFAGTTKYPLRRMLMLATDGIVGFSTVPLRIVTILGFFAATAALVGILYTLAVRLFTSSWVAGWAISFIGMLFMAGLQMLSLGIVGEYIGRIYTESKQRPLFFFQEVLNASSSPNSETPFTSTHLAGAAPEMKPAQPLG
ncbi:glycosyltransferase family 2 protein [Terriglobus aquaticus]|uniref:Glycosyltransferase family 2 protein n=1 Tax=Terriglobus aquaticus TaxID=940139 RepID=A0ABW9KNJ6_9BACT|nr:glycosyltransferase family 2 protein [Terriglobus aquaticus]